MAILLGFWLLLVLGACTNSGPTTVPPTLYTLSVSVSGSGTISSRNGISCSTSCRSNFEANTQVTLSATPASGHAFTGWDGACNGSGSCTVSMNTNRSVSANFSPAADTTPPTVTFTSPSNGQTLTSPSLSISGFVSEPSSLQYSLNSGSRKSLTGTTGFSFLVQLAQGSNTIRVFAKDAAGHEGNAEVVVTYTPPSPVVTVPVVTINSPSNNQTLSSSALTVNGTASDPEGITAVQYSLNGGSRQNTNGTTNISFSVSLVSGNNTIAVFAKDPTGSEGSAQVKVNYQPPIPISITSVNVTAAQETLEDDDSTPLTASVSGTGSYNPEVAWSIESGGGTLSSPTGTTVTYTAPVVSEPTTATLKAASVADSSKFATVAVKIKPKTGTLVGTVRVGNAPLSGVLVSAAGTNQTTDASGQFRLNLLPAGQITASFSKSAYATQNKTVTITAGQTTTLNVSMVAVTQPPTITGISVNPTTASLLSGASQTLAATVTGTGAYNPEVSWSILSGGGSLSANSGPTTTYKALSVAATTTVTVQAKSVGDPSKTATAVLTINPIPTYTLLVSKTGKGTVTSAPSGINCGSDCSEPFTQSTSVILNAFPAQGFTFEGWGGACTGRDACTVSMTQNRQVSASFKDVESPAAGIISPANGSTVGSATLNVTGWASDNVGVSLVQYSLNGGARHTVNGTNSFGFTVTLNQGNNTLQVFAHDAAGNESSSYIQVNYADTQPPVVVIASPINGSIHAEKQTQVQGSASDSQGIASLEYSLNQGARKPLSAGNAFAFNANLAIGDNQIEVFARDAGGNEGRASITVRHTCDEVASGGGLTIPSGELTEGSAANWCVDTQDSKPASLNDEGVRVKVGGKSLRLDTESGFDVRMVYPKFRNARWNLSGFTHLRVWLYSENSSPNAFQDVYIRLGSGSSHFEYHPTTEVLNNTRNQWVQYEIPLSGNTTWPRSSSDTPNLAQVDWLEVHSDTWDYGFKLWVDGLEFVTTSSTFPLTVTKSGNGTVTSSPAGINCGSICIENYPSNTQVTLAATPDTGYSFAGWGGVCSGTGTCTVTLDAAKTVSANFQSTPPATYPLTISKTGNGTIISIPSGINCGIDCQENYVGGTSVSLSATPAPGYSFSGWGGVCSGTGICSVIMNSAKTVAATFQTTAPSAPKLEVRIYNVDDLGMISVNGIERIRVGYIQDSGKVNLSQFLTQASNEIDLQLSNEIGGFTYGFQVWLNDSLILDESCGQASIQGCMNDGDTTSGLKYRTRFIVRQDGSYSLVRTDQRNWVMNTGESKTFNANTTGRITNPVTWNYNRDDTSLVEAGSGNSYAFNPSIPGTYQICANTNTGEVQQPLACSFVLVKESWRISGVSASASLREIWSGGEVNLSATVNGIGNFNPEVGWQIISGEGALSSSAGRSITFNSLGELPQDQVVVIRAFSLADSTKYQDIEITVRALLRIDEFKGEQASQGGNWAFFTWRITQPYPGPLICIVDFKDGQNTGWFDCNSIDNTTHLYSLSGTKQARLNVKMKTGYGREVARDTEFLVGTGGGNRAPIISDFKVSPNPVQPGLDTLFSWSISDPDGNSMRCILSFGDGSSQPIDGCDSGRTWTKNYQNPGVYTARLRVEDGRGGVDEQDITVTVGTSGGNGKGVCQCVWFIKIYIGKYDPWGGSAKNGGEALISQGFANVDNSPHVGDIVIFQPSTHRSDGFLNGRPLLGTSGFGIDGHTGVVIAVDGNRFRARSANMMNDASPTVINTWENKSPKPGQEVDANTGCTNVTNAWFSVDSQDRFYRRP